jgi:hypothetical protein
MVLLQLLTLSQRMFQHLLGFTLQSLPIRHRAQVELRLVRQELRLFTVSQSRLQALNGMYIHCDKPMLSTLN